MFFSSISTGNCLPLDGQLYGMICNLFTLGSIETMSFKVFNRWGELVFETTDITIGWDGTYKGQAQEMDAYAYVLSATFVDGSSQSKSGNVTLIR